MSSKGSKGMNKENLEENDFIINLENELELANVA